MKRGGKDIKQSFLDNDKRVIRVKATNKSKLLQGQIVEYPNNDEKFNDYNKADSTVILFHLMYNLLAGPTTL